MGIYASWLGALGVGFNPEHILSAEVPFKMFLRGPSFTDTLWSSEPQCSWAVPALSTLLRDGVQGAVWTEKPVLCRLGANTAHSHPDVQGRPGHLLWPLPRAHQMSYIWQLAVSVACGYRQSPGGMLGKLN